MKEPGMTISDTPGEGLDPKAVEAAENAYLQREGGGFVPNMRAAIRAFLDTAGPSEHAGLVERLKADARKAIDAGEVMIGTLTRERDEAREAIAALSRATEAYPGIADAVDRLHEAAHRDEAITISVRAQDLRNVLASLSRAPEAVAWLGEGDGFKSFTRRKSHAERWRKGGIKVTAVYATPPAPQPALALIEELERALERIADHPDTENGSFRASIARTALASAKRFKGE